MKIVSDNTFYLDAIKFVDTNAKHIRQPNGTHTGTVVFFADTDLNTFVYRFPIKSLALKNHNLVPWLKRYNIPTPKATLYNYCGTLFEKYTYDTNKTMFEHNMSSHLSDYELFTIYQECMQIEYNISKIPVSNVDKIAHKSYSRLYYTSYIAKHKKIINTIIKTAIIYIMSHIGEMRFFHNDINPMNVLLTPDKHVFSVIDVDGISLTNTYFALINMLRFAPQHMWMDLLRYYEKISHKQQPKKLVITTMKLITLIKKSWTNNRLTLR